MSFVGRGIGGAGSGSAAFFRFLGQVERKELFADPDDAAEDQEDDRERYQEGHARTASLLTRRQKSTRDSPTVRRNRDSNLPCRVRR